MCGVDPFYRGLKWEAIETVAGDGEYLDRWLGRAQLHWPPALQVAASAPTLPLADVHTLAATRRAELRPVYLRASRVCRVGVRIDFRGEDGDSSTGAVLGFGSDTIDAFRSMTQAALDNARGADHGFKGWPRASSARAEDLAEDTPC